MPEERPEWDRSLYEQQPSEEALCRYQGHAYYADEWDWRDAPPEEQDEARATAGRCYCGYQRFPAGGLTNLSMKSSMQSPGTHPMDWMHR